MSASIPYLFIAMIGIAAVVYLMVVDRRRMRVQRLRVKKLHASPMFEAMKPLIQRAQKYSIESLSIDKTGFTLRFLFPFGLLVFWVSRRSGCAVQRDNYARE